MALFSHIMDRTGAFAARGPQATRRDQKIAHLRIVWGAALE
jgi:hypothetical protein